MLINLLGQLSALAQRNDAVFSGTQTRQAQLGLSRSVGGPDYDRVNLSTIAKIHNKDNHLAFAGIKNDFIAKAMDSWYSSLAEKENKN